MESARLVADLTLFFIEMVKRVIDAVSKFDDEYDAASLEEFVRAQVAALGAVVLEYTWALRCRERGRPASVECTCGRRRLFKGRAERSIRSTLGPMNFSERFRYRCPACGAETILGDELRGEGEHLWDVGRAHFGEKSDMLTPWVKAREGELYAGSVAKVVEALKAMAEKLGAPPEGADETDPRVVLQRNVGYFEENARRMKYDEYRKKGIPIASGVVESACKHVVASRLKGSGMRWDEEGAECILHLRSLELNGRWDAFWEQNHAA